jgi:hypothetical protein
MEFGGGGFFAFAMIPCYLAMCTHSGLIERAVKDFGGL